MQQWLKQGYVDFAMGGPQALRVETLARKVGKSKSSFYHHFATIDIFTDLLLDYHLMRAKVLSEKIKQCQVLGEEVIDILLSQTTDILFNRQLRFHRDVPKFFNCFNTLNECFYDGMEKIWKEFIHLQDKPETARSMYFLMHENFYLQLSPENVTKEWFVNYFAEVQSTILNIRE